MFKRLTGKPNIEWYPKVASTAYSNGALINADGPADSTSGDHFGIIMKDVASTDSDYGSTTMVPVDVPQDGDEFEVDTAADVTASLIGTNIDLSTSLVANGAASSKKVLFVTRFLGTRKLAVKINAMAANKDVATT